MISIFGSIHSSKNSRQIHVNQKTNRPFVAKSAASKADEELLALQLSQSGNRDEWQRMTAGKGYPLRVVFHFVRATHGRWDFANLVQGVADAMVKAGYLEDDSVDFFIPVYGGYKVDKISPGVDIWIE